MYVTRRTFLALISMASLSACGGTSSDTTSIGKADEDKYHVITIEGVSFEVEKGIDLSDDVTKNEWGHWYKIGDAYTGTSKWWSTFDISEKEFSLAGNYDKAVDVGDVRVFVETRTYELESMWPNKAIVFNYRGVGHEMVFSGPDDVVESAIEHILETIHFE